MCNPSTWEAGTGGSWVQNHPHYTPSSRLVWVILSQVNETERKENTLRLKTSQTNKQKPPRNSEQFKNSK